jgi:hypothetical protein
MEFEEFTGLPEEIRFSNSFLGDVEFNKPPKAPKPPKGGSKPVQRPKDTGVFKKHLPKSGKK